ncbi:MAG: hypothetical protein ABWZ64_12430 [Xanthobacteraceae bacterium]
MAVSRQSLFAVRHHYRHLRDLCLLHAYRIDLLGRAYVHLQPLTNALYGLVETYLPVDVRYKIRGAITDDLGQRSLFLLLLTAAVELTLYSFFKFLKYLVAGSRKRA